MTGIYDSQEPSRPLSSKKDERKTLQLNPTEKKLAA